MTELHWGIKSANWDKILSLLQGNGKVSDILLFGSRAMGNFRPGSDIDLCLKGSQLNEHDFLKLRTALDMLDLPWQIDLIDYETLQDDAVREHIDRVGISLLSGER